MRAIKWKNTNLLELPASIDKTLLRTNQNTYPQFRTLLAIFLTIASTIASIDRSFFFFI